MQKTDLINALNENFALLENANITQIIHDKSGTPRIMIGLLPDQTYGIIISKPGVNVQKMFI